MVILLRTSKQDVPTIANDKTAVRTCPNLCAIIAKKLVLIK